MAQCEQGNEILKVKSYRLQGKPWWVSMVGVAGFLCVRVCVCVCVCAHAHLLRRWFCLLTSYGHRSIHWEKSTLDQ